MDAMMYKIEGEDLYLIGTSEHSMIGKFIDTINDEEKLPYTPVSYTHLDVYKRQTDEYALQEEDLPVLFEEYDKLAAEMVRRNREDVYKRQPMCVKISRKRRNWL